MINIFDNINVIIANALNDDTDIKIKKLTPQEAHKLLLSDYSQAYNSRVKLYRGEENLLHRNIDCAEVFPGTRISNHTSNFYTRMLSDVLESWQKYPPRNKSIICSTSITTAKYYTSGTPYRVFPKNDVKIAVCPMDDMWFSFIKESGIKLSELNEWFTMYLARMCYIRDFSDILNEGSKSDIESVLAEIERIIRLRDNSEIPIHRDYQKSIIDRIKSGESISEILNVVLSPDKNKFKLFDNISKINEKFSDNEMWFSGPCIMIQKDILKMLKNS